MDLNKVVNAKIQHFTTVESFKDYVNSLVKPSWFKSIITHHTAVPTVNDWTGYNSMIGMLRYYVDTLHWDRFPHVFAAPDGIWTMNKLTETGIHANAANYFSLGIEVVGNYDKVVWQEPVKSFALGAHMVLMDWGNISYSNIEPHRKYNLAKTCPGKSIQMPWVVENIKQYRESYIGSSTKETYEVIVPTNVEAIVREGPSRAYAQSYGLKRGDIFTGGDIKLDEQNLTIDGKNTWVHIKQGSIGDKVIDGIGFIHSSVVRRI